jgi:putative DNA primase/helicase
VGHGRQHGSTARFGRDLRAAVLGVSTKQPRNGEDRFRVYEGIGLTADLPRWVTDELPF